MARNIRWTIPFKSVSGVDCHVDIYDDNWSGAVTTLTGSDDPFFYSEDDSEDMLEVVRIKTGYISVVENTYGELDALRPTNTSGRYVKFWYGNRLDFIGFIQYQDFDNDWVACPRVVQFPIVSPLGLTEGRTFAKTSPQYRSLGNILYEVLQSLNAGYTKVIFPNDTPELAGKINSLVICPFSSNFPQIAQTDPALLLYDPISMMDFLTYLCNAYGWMAHDQADVLVFTRLDYTGGYYSYTYNALVVPTGKAQETEGVQPVMGNTEAALEDYFTFADDSAVMTSIQPLKSLTLNYTSRDMNSFVLPYNHSTYVSDVISNQNIAVWLKPACPEIAGGMLNTQGSQLYMDVGRPVTPGVYLSYCGESDGTFFGTVKKDNPGAPLQERILIQPSNSWQVGIELVQLKFYEHPLYFGFNLKIEMTWGVDIKSLANVERSNNLYLGYRVYNASIDESGVITIDKKTGTGVASISLPYAPGVILPISTEPLTVSLTLPSVQSGHGFQSNEVYAIERIGFEVFEGRFAKYKVYKVDFDEISGDKNSDVEGSVDMPITMYHYCIGQIDIENRSVPSGIYSYLFQQQRRLQAAFRLGTMPAHPYNIKFNYAGMNWRYIAAEFHPRDDEYRLTLQSSPVY